MKKAADLAPQLMKMVNDMTGWGFSLMHQKDKELVGTTISKKEDEQIHVIFDVRNTGLTVQVSCDGCAFDEEYAATIFDGMGFPVEARGESGETLVLSTDVTLDRLEEHMDLVVTEIMGGMFQAIVKVLDK